MLKARRWRWRGAGLDAVAAVTVRSPSAPCAGELVALPWRAPWMVVRLGILHLRGHRPGEAEGAFLDLLRTADREAEARAPRLLGGLGFGPAA